VSVDPDSIDFTKGDGLVPAIVQDADTGAVLMLGYMNREAVEQTLARKRAVFFSRSKQRLWEKGETTGHTLDVVDVALDCDNDTLLVTAHPRGPACHNGTVTCFGDATRSAAGDIAFLSKLESVIAQRASDKPENSYTARLLAKGLGKVAQKVGEEGRGNGAGRRRRIRTEGHRGIRRPAVPPSWCCYAPADSRWRR
jgi:phosphoribosyl-ATP pyrophosphohydrolase/phosphoribosyl-AMP cyclohydrolase